MLGPRLSGFPDEGALPGEPSEPISGCRDLEITESIDPDPSGSRYMLRQSTRGRRHLGIPNAVRNESRNWSRLQSPNRTHAERRDQEYAPPPSTPNTKKILTLTAHGAPCPAALFGDSPYPMVVVCLMKKPQGSSILLPQFDRLTERLGPDPGSGLNPVRAK